MNKPIYIEFGFWKPILFILALFVAAAIGGYAYGYQQGATRAQLTTLAEVKRQCDSPWPLLLGNEFFRCYSTHQKLKP